MKRQMKYFLSSIIIIILSTPLAYTSIRVVYSNRNLTGEFVPMLNGFIHSYMVVGVLIFGMGLIDLLINKNN